jgi:hypothetical protein
MWSRRLGSLALGTGEEGEERRGKRRGKKPLTKKICNTTTKKTPLLRR